MLIRQATIPSLHDAVALYAGDLLAGWGDDWLLTDRERLRQMQLNSLRRLAAHHRALGQAATALALIRRALDLDPLAEARLDQALALFRGLDTRWQLGCTWLEQAELALARDDPVTARALFSQASTEFEALGAAPAAARMRAKLRAL